MERYHSIDVDPPGDSHMFVQPISFSAFVCGAWSVAIRSAVPSTSASQVASPSGSGTSHPSEYGPNFSIRSHLFARKTSCGLTSVVMVCPFALAALMLLKDLLELMWRTWSLTPVTLCRLIKMDIALSKMIESYNLAPRAYSFQSVFPD